MKDVTFHHDGYGLNEGIQVIAADEVGPGGAHHVYRFVVDGEMVGFLQFQKGPRHEEGSTKGVTGGAVLAALIDQAIDFQNGPFPSDEGGNALDAMEAALHCLKRRADERAQRNVLGSNKL